MQLPPSSFAPERARPRDASLGERLDMIQRVAHVGFWEMRVSDRRLVVSGEMRSLFGLDLADPEPDFDTLLACVHPDDQEYVLAELGDALQHSSVLDVEHRIVHPSGEVRHVHARGEQVTATDREPTYYGTVQDITARKRAEDALRRSEERFRLVARATSDVIWDLDLRTNHLWFSGNLQDLFGYTPHDCDGSRALWRDHLHPDDSERVLQHFEHAVNGSDDIWSDDYRFVRKDGSIAHVHDRAHILRC